MFILVCKSSFFIFDCFLLLCYGLLSGLLLSLNNNDNNNNNNDDDDDDDDDEKKNRFKGFNREKGILLLEKSTSCA